MDLFKRAFGLWVLILVLVSWGCGNKDEAATTEVLDRLPPTAVISQPVNEARFAPGQAVQINVVVNDDVAVGRVELYVDGSLVESRVVPADMVLTAWSEPFAWSASMVGAHTLQVYAYDRKGQRGASSLISIYVGEAPSPTSPAPQASLTPLPAQETQTPLPSAAPEQPSATPTQVQALVTADRNANVRGGPGTNYAVVGGLKEGETAVVTGRNADSSWWQINFNASTAWVADIVVNASDAARAAPVVDAPPPPPTYTPAPATATTLPTATSGPTNTPVPGTGFRVDRATLAPGQCTTLRWDFGGISAIYISFGDDKEEGAPGHGTREICPEATTTYRARVVKTDGSEEFHDVRVVITSNSEGCGDPVVERFVPTAYEVNVNEPFSIFWDVTCAAAVWLIQGDGAEEAVTNNGNRISLRITSDTTFQLKMQTYSGGYIFESFTVKIK